MYLILCMYLTFAEDSGNSSILWNECLFWQMGLTMILTGFVFVFKAPISYFNFISFKIKGLIFHEWLFIQSSPIMLFYYLNSEYYIYFYCIHLLSSDPLFHHSWNSFKSFFFKSDILIILLVQCSIKCDKRVSIQIIDKKMLTWTGQPASRECPLKWD